FWVDLYNPTFASIADDRGFGVIRDNDDLARVSIVPVTPIGGLFRTEVTEDNSMQVPVSFIVQLSADSGKPIVVTDATSPGTAIEAFPTATQLPDYTGIPNESMPANMKQLTFNPGDPLTQIITVMVNPDNLVEGDEMFF